MFQSTKWRRTDSLLAHWSRWMGSYLSAHKQHEQTEMSPECFRWINQIIHCYLHLLWEEHEEGFHLHQTDGFRKNKNKSLIRWSLTRKVNRDYLVEEEVKLFEHLSISMWPRSKTFGKQKTPQFSKSCELWSSIRKKTTDPFWYIEMTFTLIKKCD